MLLNVNDLSKNYGYNQLFKGVSFTLNDGDILSIVGHNGCGKSTLLKIIAGLETPDKGTVSIQKKLKVGYLSQKINNNTDKTCIDYLMDSFSEIIDIYREIQKYEKLVSENPTEKVVNKYCELIDRFSSMDGYQLENKIKEVCNGLNISDKLLNQKFQTLSGGEKTIIELAKCLLSKPNILLLDEPTNYLDIGRIEWLEDYIKKFKGGIIMVSHDRYFLNELSTKILDLSEEEPTLYNLKYYDYLEEKEKRFERQMSDYKLQQLQIKKLEAEISYFLQKADQTKSSAMYDRAKQLREKIDKIKNYGVKKPKVNRRINMNFSEAKDYSKRMLSVENLTVLKENGEPILENINMGINYGESVALIGNNGSGKSTFINTILNNNNLEHSGNIIIGPSTKIGYLPQIIEFKNDNLTIIDYFKQEVGCNEEVCRRILANFKFKNDEVRKKVKNLSEGEKIRLKLAVLLQDKINCLIFDEPTNHIDIDTKEVLEDAISSFEGTFIFVSHDRYFINKFANKVIEFKNHNIETYLGNYDYYKEKVESTYTL